jgi:hypothetical protein
MARAAMVAFLWLCVTACGARGGLANPELRRDADVGEDAGRDAGSVPPDGGPRVDGGTDAGPMSDIGDPCAGPSSCLAADEVVDVPACIEGGVWPNGGLWTDGYCTAQCTPTTAPGEGDALAQDDCPAGALCVPYEGVGVCLLACESDAGCRPSDLPSGPYACRRSFAGEPLEVGVCASSHCLTRGCPGSARCDC